MSAGTCTAVSLVSRSICIGCGAPFTRVAASMWVWSLRDVWQGLQAPNRLQAQRITFSMMLTICKTCEILIKPVYAQTEGISLS